MSQLQIPIEQLELIVGHYLNDALALADARKQHSLRAGALPDLQATLYRFIEGQSTIDELYQSLDLYLRQHDYWGTVGFWEMHLNQLATHHKPNGEIILREALDGLNHTNFPQRLEKFTQELRDEAKRVAHQGKKRVAPGRSPFFLGLFAAWLDPKGMLLVPWPNTRKGLKVLYDHNLLVSNQGIAVSEDEVLMRDADQYNAALEAVAAIGTTFPELIESSDIWAESFTNWVYEHRAQIPVWLGKKEIIVSFPDEPLKPIEPQVLAERIKELRRTLLISEDLIKRMYQALVLGRHIILSGPPGTGKTQLAAKLPAILWQTSEPDGVAPTMFTPSNTRITEKLTTKTSYTVRIETATDEWTPRHVIGGLAPVLDEDSDQIRYDIAAGCLTQTIIDNWEIDQEAPETWGQLKRKPYFDKSNGTEQQYRGIWLVIDEFNRAPIDLALGEALTAMSGGQTSLTVPTRNGSQPLRIPRDFRIIGTLNTFDRHFLNQMSEALKRRFVFIEVLPPDRSERTAEQATVVHEALKQLPHVSWATDLTQVVETKEGTTAPWEVDWDTNSAVYQLFMEGWRFFEVIRIYRQFGTAQAIAWCSSFLGAGLLQGLDTNDQVGWRACLSTALADTLADQLQILFPDEIESLLAYLRSQNGAEFAAQYNAMLARQTSPKRRNAQMLALQSVRNDAGQTILAPDLALQVLTDEQAILPSDVLDQIFHASQMRGSLPDMVGRLERFLFERMI